MSDTTKAAPTSWRDSILPYAKKGPLTAFFVGISSGLPFTLLAATLTQRLSEGGIERRTISAFALVLLIYSIKWAWAPIVDRIRLPFSDSFGQRRTWLVLCAAAVIAAIVLLARADPADGAQKVLLAALILGFAGATYDIVIDAYRIETLEPEELGTGSGMSQYGWRIGAFLAGTVALAGAASVDWTFGYIACAPLALSAVIVSLWAGEPKRHKMREWPQRGSAGSYRRFLLAIPLILAAAFGLDQLLGSTILFRISLFGLIYPIADMTIRRAHDAGWSGHLAWLLLAPPIAAAVGNLTLFWIALALVGALVAALAVKAGDSGANRFGDAPDALVRKDVVGPMVEFFRRRGAWLVFIFVLVHKIGDTMANLMVRDLFVTSGFSREEILFADVWVGFACLMIGIFVGGIIYARWGMKRAVLVSLLLMGVSNFSFAILAELGRSVPMMAFTMGFENFASGIGGVAVVAFLSAVCSLRFTATQFAMLSAAAAILGRFLTGATAGALINAMGYPNFYLLTTALALPGILLFWWMMRSGLVDAALGSAGTQHESEVRAEDQAGT
ncbi:AmpG family muropeptide MFS transporter [Sphingosinicella sp.]|uniref:AmpG family muropeptide MFS transporter n=1 Tax=Sphingosinicella sp. TaxID=1917971 RepID=UPI004037C77D